ncbi:phosphoinositide 3-kinase regulatory subunit 6 [Centropristis striata]|uniref:phosphoinositide 3-kinase regulatory subunit 6 n=1 Tax=Centropristis striata TaxID=184440 RepID=UPI0027E0899C|nr:phosphoinositide 3-kinase regulatory subunit 6 [Centropristis striata]
MVDPVSAVDVALSPVESSLYNNVQALLKDMSSQSASHKGVLRWSLHKKLEADPCGSISLIRMLVKELDKELRSVKKIPETQSYKHVIPVLLTLYYAVIQSSVVIPTSLYQTVCERLMKLLILPSPYSAVALSTLRNIKMEMSTPGSLYQRKVTSEQNLRNSTLQEKVFVLADPAVFSAPLEAAVRAHLETSSLVRDTTTMEINLVQRVLQMGMGATCHSSRLAQALEVKEHTVDTFFQKVVVAVEQSVMNDAGGRANYLKKLQRIYRDILTASEEGFTKLEHDSACSTEMPFPEINFLLWKDEEDLWDLLANLTRCSCSNSTSVDEEEKEKRDSVQSADSGIGRDLKDFDDTLRSPVTNPTTSFSRRNAFKSMKPADRLSLMKEKIDAFPGNSNVLDKDAARHTARVVVMGDDRVLGRLTRAYHSIRERESKRLILTKKLNLRLYYIPVTDEEPSFSSPESPSHTEDRLSLASVLGRVDPWYDSNINSLGAAISKLPGTLSNHNKTQEQNFFLLDTLCYYLRCGTQPVNLPLYSVKMTRIVSDVSSVVEEVFVSHLEADIPEFRHLKETIQRPSARRKKSVVSMVLGAVISINYTKMSLSKREVVKGDAPMTCGLVITSEPAAVTSGMDHLTVRFDSVNPGQNTTIQTQNISIRTLEQRRLSVCLDKDPRRTYTDVQRVEISPCLDPGCSVRTRIGSSQDRELLLSKYLDKVLSLPINTFTGMNS